MAIGITDKFKPKGGADIALMDAEDIEHNGLKLTSFLAVEITEAEHNYLVDSGKIDENQIYIILEEE